MSKARRKKKTVAPVIPQQNILHDAIALHNAGRLDEAKVRYQKIAKKKPPNPDALYQLGRIALQSGNIAESIDLLTKAIQIKSTNPNYHNELALAYITENNLAKATKHWQKAASLDSDNPDIYSNLSAALINSCLYQEAEKHASQALALAPQHAQALHNRGAALAGQQKNQESYPFFIDAINRNPEHPDYHTSAGKAALKIGYIDQGIQHIKDALALAPNHELALYQQALLDIMPLPMDQRGIICVDFLNNAPPHHMHQANMLIKLAVFYWAMHDYNKAKEMLAICANTPVSNDAQDANAYENIHAYSNFLQKLLNTNPIAQPHNTVEQNIILMGDSHCLSYAGQTVECDSKTHRITPHLIEGGKAWHLGSEKNTLLGYMFRTALTHIPKGTTCWLSFGEIDCRLTEGIQKVAKKNPNQAIEDIIRDTATSYVQRTTALLGEHDITPTYLNVPAPYIDELRKAHPELTEQDFERHTKTIALFNSVLQETASSKGGKIIDIYSLTKNSDGIADGKWHIDGYHLLPNALAAAQQI